MFFLKTSLFGNPIADWIEAAVLLIALTFLSIITKKILARRFKSAAERKPNGFREIAREIIGRTRSPVLFLVALFLAGWTLKLSGRSNEILYGIALAAIFVQIGIWGSYLIQTRLHRFMNRRVEGPGGQAGLAIMILFGRIILWISILLLILQNLGVNVTTLIASLGIGGIAIGLATQNILSDLFASLSILLDRPFEAGHFIIVDNYMGTVEKVGLKTTRIRSVNGELLVFGNNDLLKSRIRNFANFQERRVVFTLGVLYDTPAEKLREIPGMIRRIIEDTGNTRFDRAHFKAFGDFSLNFEVVYFVLSADYVLYMDVKEKINLEIIAAFEREGIGFAFPTRTVHIAGGAPVRLAGASGEEK